MANPPSNVAWVTPSGHLSSPERDQMARNTKDMQALVADAKLNKTPGVFVGLFNHTLPPTIFAELLTLVNDIMCGDRKKETVLVWVATTQPNLFHSSSAVNAARLGVYPTAKETYAALDVAVAAFESKHSLPADSLTRMAVRVCNIQQI